METKFDYSQTYYKVTNENECHNGYQYKDGLNILTEKFNDDPNDSCVPGGFYFTDYEHLPDFFWLGTWIREITIPTDARVIKDPDGDKWRTDKIILGNKYHIKNDFAKWFDKEKFNWKEYSYFFAVHFSRHFDKWFDAEKFNWEDSFFLAEYCSNYFPKWFNPEKYNWEYSGYLAKYCSNNFARWFDAAKFNWNYSGSLAIYCSQYFDKWFDAEKFNWDYSNFLVEYCHHHFVKWFDPKKFDWYCADILIKYCNTEFILWKQEHPDLLQYVPEKYR